MADDKSTTKNLQAARKASMEQTAKNVEANSGLKAPTGAALQKAQQDGAVEAVKESAKDTYKALTDGALPGGEPGRQFTGMDDIMQYAGILDLGIDEFKQRVEKGGPVPEEKVAGLLSLERAGKNRTPYVQALKARLGIKHVYEVTTAGPGYTNDVHPVSDL